MMSTGKNMHRIAFALCVLAADGCASAQSGSGFNSFLRAIAAECKPLIIGSENMGEAIVFNGLGANPDHYNTFLAQTEALYNGGISSQVYRSSMTSFIGAGSSNQRSFDCIEAHLPSQSGAAPAPK
jgi:hypothetical protein